MKYFLFILLFLMPHSVFSQILNLKYQYTEVCSDEIRSVNIPININNNNTIAFFGYSKTFSEVEISQNDHVTWLNSVYKKWKEYYPCAEIKELVVESSQSVSEKSDVDINQPIVVMTADMGYRKGGTISTSGGYNITNLETKQSRGILLTSGTDYNGNIGFYRITPLKNEFNNIINANLLFLGDSFLANLTNGLTGDGGKYGSYFLFHTITFGKLNGYPFQDNTFIFGYNKKILDTRRFIISSNLLTSYTYRVKVFNIRYWFEDYIQLKPFINFGFKITPTFALNLSYTSSIRTDVNYKRENKSIYTDRYAILLGGRVLF